MCLVPQEIVPYARYILGSARVASLVGSWDVLDDNNDNDNDNINNNLPWGELFISSGLSREPGHHASKGRSPHRQRPDRSLSA